MGASQVQYKVTVDALISLFVLKTTSLFCDFYFFYIVLCYILWTEYYAEVWGVSRESISSEEKAKKKWIVHVKNV